METTLGPAPATGDPSLAESLVANLVENALRHNLNGGRAEIATKADGRRAVISMANTGPVVAPDQVDRLFQPFQRLGGERVGSGYGLGLAIVRAIASAHGATLTAKARPEGGLDVEVSFAEHGDAHGRRLSPGLKRGTSPYPEAGPARQTGLTQQGRHPEAADGEPGRERDMDAVVEWVDARERLPRSGYPVAAAVSGRYPAEPGEASGEDYWLVLAMYFTDRHIAEDGTEYRDCFVDSDRVVRLPYGRPGDEPVTHWAALPALPGLTVHHLLGQDARTALRNALG